MGSNNRELGYVPSGEVCIIFEPPLQVKEFAAGNEIGAIARYAYERDCPDVTVEEYEIAVGRRLVEALSKGIDTVILKAFEDTFGPKHKVYIVERLSLQVGEEDLES
jgi:hypothetical protein